MSLLARSMSMQMDRVARRFGYRVFPDWVLNPAQNEEIEHGTSATTPAELPPGATSYLRRDNARLLELRSLYGELSDDVKTSLVWTEKFVAQPDLANFRGDNMWVHQKGHRHLQERAYLLAAYYVIVHDRLDLLQTLKEDGAFGAITFEIAGRRVSRDLLDSILEIEFLDRHLQIASRPDISILDIGAGYGRLAYRMLSAFPQMSKYYCTDAIAESSFVCEYYLRYRGMGGRFRLVPSPEIDSFLAGNKVDLAVNIHSFSECTTAAVQWWLEKLNRYEVKNFLIVPNAGNHCGQLLSNNVGEDMFPVIERSGYELLARESKYTDPEVQKFALNPTCYWLFQRSA
jgi:hypothetical protein